MSSRKKGKEGKKNTDTEVMPTNVKWIPARTGMALIAFCSMVMVVFTSWQLIPVLGWFEGLKYALFYGAMIWVVFFAMKLFYRFTQR